MHGNFANYSTTLGVGGVAGRTRPHVSSPATANLSQPLSAGNASSRVRAYIVGRRCTRGRALHGSPLLVHMARPRQPDMTAHATPCMLRAALTAHQGIHALARRHVWRMEVAATATKLWHLLWTRQVTQLARSSVHTESVIAGHGCVCVFFFLN